MLQSRSAIRNGYREVRLKTSEGKVRFAVRQVLEADVANVAGHLFGERPVLKMMFGVLIRVTEK